jgi:hypothetical protein
MPKCPYAVANALMLFLEATAFFRFSFGWLVYIAIRSVSKNNA